MRQTFLLPYPPSANKLWRAVNGRNIKSKAYRDYEDKCLWEIALQRIKPVRGAYQIEFKAGKPDKRRRDISNLIKGVEDCVVTSGVIQDDAYCQKLSIEWAKGIQGVEVTLWEVVG